MYERFSKLSKLAIVTNVVLSIIMIGFNLYLLSRSIKSYKLLDVYLLEHNVDFQTAVRELTKQGNELIFALYGSIVGIVLCSLAIFLLVLYARKNSFAAGFGSATMCLFTNFIGGLLMYYAFFSKRREVKKEERSYVGKDDFSQFIHKRVLDD